MSSELSSEASTLEGGEAKTSQVVVARYGELWLKGKNRREFERALVRNTKRALEGYAARGIEVGHIFQLGRKYSVAMALAVLDGAGQPVAPWMGCYGIGINRIIATAIEQNHDDRGIIWPEKIAPFQVAIVPMQMHKSPRVKEASEAIYQQLANQGVEILFDDRSERPGVMFSDMDLIGIPHRIVIGERGLDNGVIEYKYRRDEETQDIKQSEFIAFLMERLNKA